jgi:hypothetical protein
VFHIALPIAAVTPVGQPYFQKVAMLKFASSFLLIPCYETSYLGDVEVILCISYRIDRADIVAAMLWNYIWENPIRISVRLLLVLSVYCGLP